MDPARTGCASCGSQPRSPTFIGRQYNSCCQRCAYTVAISRAGAVFGSSRPVHHRNSPRISRTCSQRRGRRCSCGSCTATASSVLPAPIPIHPCARAPADCAGPAASRTARAQFGKGRAPPPARRLREGTGHLRSIASTALRTVQREPPPTPPERVRMLLLPGERTANPPATVPHTRPAAPPPAARPACCRSGATPSNASLCSARVPGPREIASQVCRLPR